MWPMCIETLKPFPRSLEADVPVTLSRAFSEVGWPTSGDAFPIELTALLGSCSTDRYSDCPTLPEWHVEHAQEDGDEYLEYTGRYHWCDFNLIDSSGRKMVLRMTFNEGDADCNDGTWGLVWDRENGEVVAELTSVGDCLGLITAVSEKHLRCYSPHSLPIPTDDDSFGSEELPFELSYANDSEFEKLIGIAMRWCHGYVRQHRS